jgi:hypothetical protein
MLAKYRKLHVLTAPGEAVGQIFPDTGGAHPLIFIDGKGLTKIYIQTHI